MNPRFVSQSLTLDIPVIRSFDHLARLLDEFEIYYNDCRGHTTLTGALPSVIHRGGQWSKPEKSAKILLANVEQLVFADTGITAYRLAA